MYLPQLNSIEPAQTFDFEAEKNIELTLDTLKRTHKENDIYGHPLKGFYHYEAIERIADAAERRGLMPIVSDLWAAQNASKSAPGVVLLPQVVLGQSKAETSQYTKLLRKPTVKAAEKFMGKFPQSAYTAKVLRLRDSLLFYTLNPEDAEGVKAFVKDHPESPFLPQAEARIKEHNTSPLTHEEALSIAGNCLDAVGWRKDNVDYILALDDGLAGEPVPAPSGAGPFDKGRLPHGRLAAVVAGTQSQGAYGAAGQAGLRQAGCRIDFGRCL